LFVSSRWITSTQNIFTFALLYIICCLALGLTLALALDRQVRGEGVLRSIFLYPYALSYVVTGLAWQWLLNPSFGLNSYSQQLGGINIDWLVNSETAIYAIIAAAVWQGSGFIMVLLLASLRGVDPQIWHATKVDGIPAWRTYRHIILPNMAPMLTLCVLLLAVSVVKSYDLVVAMTNGGPGIASELPAKYVVDSLFERNNIGLAMAGAAMLLLSVICAAIPLGIVYLLHTRQKRP
jgi:glucose/mannose transport system permease protein